MGNLVQCKKHKNHFMPPYKCKKCKKENEILEHIDDIEARFYTFTLHEQVEQDFIWVVKELKRIIRNGSI